MGAQRRRAAVCLPLLLILIGTLGCSRSVAGTPLAGAPAPSTSTSASASPSNQPGALIPGWQPVRSAKRKAAFDAPPGWSVKPDSIVMGYENGSDIVAGSGGALFRDGFCPGHSGSSRALAVLASSKTPDLAQAALEAATRWATLAYLDEAKKPPQLTPSNLPADPTKTLSGLVGRLVKITARPASQGPCGSPAGVVWVLASTIQGATVLLVVVADTDVPDAANQRDLLDILTTLRESN